MDFTVKSSFCRCCSNQSRGQKRRWLSSLDGFSSKWEGRFPRVARQPPCLLYPGVRSWSREVCDTGTAPLRLQMVAECTHLCYANLGVIIHTLSVILYLECREICRCVKNKANAFFFFFLPGSVSFSWAKHMQCYSGKTREVDVELSRKKSKMDSLQNLRLLFKNHYCYTPMSQVCTWPPFS